MPSVGTLSVVTSGSLFTLAVDGAFVSFLSSFFASVGVAEGFDSGTEKYLHELICLTSVSVYTDKANGAIACMASTGL